MARVPGGDTSSRTIANRRPLPHAAGGIGLGAVSEDAYELVRVAVYGGSADRIRSFAEYGLIVDHPVDHLRQPADRADLTVHTTT